MNHRHPMPFGAHCLDEGGVAFRLWAPSAKQVDLCLNPDQNEQRLPMTAIGQGWHYLDVPSAGPGSRYRFRIDGGMAVPDPASRFNPDDVHGAGEVIDPLAFAWHDDDWIGRDWAAAVLYEVHVGALTPEGTFAAVIDRLDYLVDLGVTAIELMPVADFPGRWNWGYDGALPFAPDSRYGRPEDLKALVQAAHDRGLTILLDVVYNHFGPEGNYLHLYAPAFFDAHRHTPWGAAIDFGQRTVRDFFIDNALYWLEEYRFDGLRLDAVHAIQDDSRPDIVEELAERVRAGPGRERLIHLVLENDRNQARYLSCYDAQWNDDWHHACHVLLTGEDDGYYADSADTPERHLARCLAEGFAWQGEASAYRDGAPRGEPSGHLPASAFVAFLQSHDQVGNRARGERLAALAEPDRLKAATAALLLSPQPPMLFMGEEFAASTPFLYFCDFDAELGAAVRAGRQREFARFQRFGAALPDPTAESSFAASQLDWSCLEREPHRDWLDFYRTLLALRRRVLGQRLNGCRAIKAAVLGPGAVRAAWRLGDGAVLTLLVNLGPAPVAVDALPALAPLYAWPAGIDPAWLPPAATVWYVEP